MEILLDQTKSKEPDPKVDKDKESCYSENIYPELKQKQKQWF